MSFRRCVYKGCENYSVNSVPNGSFTLFQFPKDPIRRQKWMELGLVNKEVPPNCLYMCSDHFDHSKHMSINQRRNVLLGTALPYAYDGKSSRVENNTIITEPAKMETIECTNQENTPYMFFHEVEVDVTVQEHNEVVEEEQFPVESTIEDDDEVNVLAYRAISAEAEENGSDDVESENSYACVGLGTSYRGEIEKTSMTPNKKRRLTETVSQSKDDKRLTATWKELANKQKSNIHTSVKTSPNAQHSRSKLNSVTKRISEPDGNNAVHADFDESALIDTQHVTTFIFKGEEYVQMPKDQYLRDKIALKQKIERYENALKSIKQKLSVLD